MAINTAHWEFRSDKTIRYIGGAHGTSTASYASVLELHRLAQDLGDNEAVTNDDFLDITVLNPTDKSFDTIISLVNGWTLDEAFATPASEYLYGGSIIQGTGGTEVIWDGIKIVANQGVLVDIIQNDAILTNRFWNNVIHQSVDATRKTVATATVGVGSAGTNVVVSDSSEFTAGDKIMFGTVTDEEYLVDRVVDGTNIELTVTPTTIPSNSDAIYFSTRGINPDQPNGVAMQFMVKVRDAGSDIDNRTLIFTTREWYYSYSEFRVPATGRGENTVPLGYVTDLNNTTTWATIDAIVDITNLTAGYIGIDVNDDTVNEFYYSRWDRGANDINTFYEYQKHITSSGETATIYGLPGQTFRGITHSVQLLAAPSPGAWTEGASINWDAGASTGQVLAYDTANDIVHIQLLTGIVPGASETLTDGTNTATTAAGTPTSEQTVSTPVCGQSTGSALVGAFGFALEFADMAVNDKFIALDGVTRSPPRNVTFTLNGVANNYRVLVGPEDGGGGLLYTQLSNDALINTTVTSIVVTEAIPANTPKSTADSGGATHIRIQRADGSYSRHAYTAVDGPTRTFTIASTDFSGNNIQVGANIFISYIDVTATGTSVNFSTIQSQTQDLYLEARFGGTGPDYTDSIKPAVGKGTLGATDSSANLSPISDA